MLKMLSSGMNLSAQAWAMNIWTRSPSFSAPSPSIQIGFQSSTAKLVARFFTGFPMRSSIASWTRKSSLSPACMASGTLRIGRFVVRNSAGILLQPKQKPNHKPLFSHVDSIKYPIAAYPLSRFLYIFVRTGTFSST